ncbi:hypothetical protein SAMN04489712_13823 [Thermomonospora echinospora]|uniref:Uncharacterized protein n=1 Tax=Thermomonospora echinospora TaxID=1992 RepID=A0A1H6E8S6_9ACTN|nr:hypothetical protein [Thermomonospora echinospora]SEG93334.1 hypothetical protein SAMN04489712_13823 [Thermomonospora echinospora]
MRFPIDSTRLTFVVADAPQQARDFKTKQPKTTPEGAPVFVVSLLAMDGKDSAPVRVRLAGDPGLAQGQPVQVAGLVLNKSSGASDMSWWTADAVLPLAPAPSQGGPRSASTGKAPA